MRIQCILSRIITLSFYLSYVFLPRVISNDEILENHSAKKIFSCNRDNRRDIFIKGWTPVLLYSFPGSGNTWVRQLIEYSTGTFSGSLYSDGYVRNILPRENSCDNHLSIVKAHPHYSTFEGLYNGTFKSERAKCFGKVKNFTRVILLYRDPYKSIWAEYQRRISDSHVNGILKSRFINESWKDHMIQLSYNYRWMWERQYSLVEQYLPPTNYIYVKYEDLLNDTIKVDILHNIAKFIGLTASRNLAQCAFNLTERRTAHRGIDPNRMVTIDQAFTPELSCGAWLIFGEFAKKLSYKPFGGYDCENGQYQNLSFRRPLEHYPAPSPLKNVQIR